MGDGNIYIAIFPNKGKEKSKEILEKIVSYFKTRDVNLILTKEDANFFGHPELTVEDMSKIPIDVALSIGGDGTLLGVIRHFNYQPIPVCGINLGTLGFLADIETSELEKRLEKIRQGDYRIEKRLILSGYVRTEKNPNDKIFLGNAINDVVVTKSGVARMLRIDLGIDDTRLVKCRADGIIVSTATGSTAYSLSAGGPIMNSNVRALLLTPICAHTFQFRPMVLNENDIVHIKVESGPTEILVTFDGQKSAKVSVGDEIIVEKSTNVVKIIRFEDKDFYSILKNKLL